MFVAVLKMSVGALFYRNVTRRFSTLFLAVTVGAYVSNYAFNGVTDFYWDTVSPTAFFASICRLGG